MNHESEMLFNKEADKTLTLALYTCTMLTDLIEM